MKGKILILIIVVLTLVVLALGWYLLRDVMIKYDIEEKSMPAPASTNFDEVTSSVQGFHAFLS